MLTYAMNPRKRDITHLIKQLEEFAECGGIRLEALFAFSNLDWSCITVNGEIHLREGTSISRNLVLNIEAYGKNGDLVASGIEYVWFKEFFGFHTFSAGLQGWPPEEITQIRFQPRFER
jgi:hypothetical protein